MGLQDYIKQGKDAVTDEKGNVDYKKFESQAKDAYHQYGNQAKDALNELKKDDGKNYTEKAKDIYHEYTDKSSSGASDAKEGAKKEEHDFGEKARQAYEKASESLGGSK